MNSYFIADIHAHPALKAYLFRRNLGRHYSSSASFWPWASRTDFVVLRRGGVRLLWSSLYVPERELFQQCFLMRLIGLFRSSVIKGDPTDLVFRMMDEIEGQIEAQSSVVRLARSNAELEQSLSDGKIALVHTVEGAHVLGNDLRMVERLAERGVASLTLAHFYPNAVVPPVGGIPDSFRIARLCRRFNFHIQLDGSLTPFGEDVVREMVRLRMIVDISHCPRPVRWKVFELVDGRTPVVATHTGLCALNPQERNLYDDEVMEIRRTGGVVGVIFMNYWLDPQNPDSGLDSIWRTIRHLAQVGEEGGGGESFDHIALGSDFDGFTDPPDDLTAAAALPKVAKKLLDMGVSEDNVRKVMGENARRVLRTGWR